MNSLFAELRRRHVFRVAAGYAVVAWLLIQIAETTFPAFGAPDWVLRVVIIVALLGLPLALVLAWAFEVTADGVRRDEPTAAALPAPAPKRRAARRKAAWAGIGVLVALVTVGTYGWVRSTGSAATDAAAAPGAEAGAIRSIAVLPFVNVSADPANDWFSEGVSEEILNALSQVPQLRVAARTSAFSFRGSAVQLDSIGRALGVENVLEGSVRTVGDRVRITARLVEAETGDQLWSSAYDREASQVLAVQEEIAVAIANALQVRLAGEQASLTRSRTTDPVAYELYLQGRQLASRRTGPDLTKSIARFEAALERDPAFAAAYSGLADAYALLEDYGDMSRDVAFPRAIAAAHRALELDELQAEAHTSIGHVHYEQENWAAAEASYLRALELNPSYAQTYHWYGNLLASTGRFEEAWRAYERAAILDPLSPTIRRARASSIYYARRPEEAIAYYRQQIRAYPGEEDHHNWLARVYLSTGNYAGAIAEMQRVLELLPADESNVWARAQLAAAYAGAGQAAEARRILDEIEELEPDHGADSRIAAAYGFLGDNDRAFHWLNAAVDRNDWMVRVLHVIPLLDPLREDPRFAAVLARARNAPPATHRP